MLFAISKKTAEGSQPWVKTARKLADIYLSQSLLETSGKGETENWKREGMKNFD